MSIDCCVKCDQLVDTDKDDCCYVPGRFLGDDDPGYDACVCPRCRDELEFPE